MKTYTFDANLMIKSARVDAVPCDLTIPGEVGQSPTIRIRPSNEQFNAFMFDFKGSLHGTVAPREGPELIIESPCTYFNGVMQIPNGDGSYRCEGSGEPQDLHLVHGRRSTPKPGVIRFSVSRNPWLDPGVFAEHCVKYPLESRVGTLIASHSPFRRGVFHNAHMRLSFRGTHAFWETSAIEEEFVDAIEVFLLVTNLATRIRTVWLGWRSRWHGGFSEFYRGHTSVPTLPTSDSREGTLVRPDSLVGFTRAATSILAHSRYRESITTAIHALRNDKLTLEAGFVALFSAFEALVLSNRRIAGREYIVEGEDAWKRLSKDLRRTLKSNDELTKNQRSLIYKNLIALKRVPLEDATRAFLDDIKLQVDDLWPLFEGEVALSKIRNWLVHGEPREFNSNALFVASENLRHIVERAILRILNFDLSISRVHGENMKLANLSAIDAQSESMERIGVTMKRPWP